MKNFNLFIRSILPSERTGQFAGVAVAFAMALLLPGRLYAQSPSVSYASPQSYHVGTPVAALAPTSSNVAAWGYSNSAAEIGSGFIAPLDVAVDAAGNVYVVDAGLAAIVKIPASGSGQIFIGASGSPAGVAVDAAGNVYIADRSRSVIKEILAGSGTTNNLGSGFNAPTAVAVDGSGNVYVADTGNGALKEIPAGNGTPVTIKSGFSDIEGVAVDAAGNIFVADAGVSGGGGAIDEILAQSGTMSTLGTGPGQPSGVAVDAAGNLYVCFQNESFITVIEPNGAQFNFGSGFISPTGIAIDGSGNLYVADLAHSKVEVLKINGGYFISPLLPAGLTFDNNTGVISGTPTAVSPAANYTVTGRNAGGSATATVNIAVYPPSPSISYASPQTYQVGTPIAALAPTSSNVAAWGYGSSMSTIGPDRVAQVDVATDAAGNIYLLDINGTPLKITPDNNPVLPSFFFNNPTGLAVDASGNWYFAAIANSEIIVSSPDFLTLYGIGSGLNNPSAVAVDGSGNVYVGENSSGLLKEILAGNGTTVTIQSGFNNIQGIAVDASGNIYVADAGDGVNPNSAVYKIPAHSGTRVALSIGFSRPTGVAVDAAGNVYVCYINQSFITVFEPNGSHFNIGSGFNGPNGLAIDRSGNLYVADSGNNDVKEVKINGGYFISPLLPAGLTFDNSTGIISGMPTAASPAVNYTVTGWNAGGSSTATVNITVNPLLPTLSYSSPQTYKVGTPIAALAPTSSNVAAWGYSNSVASVGSGIIEPLDVAADAAGNVYAADIAAGKVVKIPTGNGTPVPLGAFSALGVAVDVNGNVYVANAGSPSIIEIAAGTGTISPIGSGLTSPAALAVDASGNVYVADNAATLKQIPAGNGTPVTIKTGFASIQGIAVDAAGNIYVADAGVGTSGNGAVYKIPAGGGSMVSVGTGFSQPSGIVVDAAGNLYVADINKSVITVIEPNGTQFTIGSGFNQPNGLALDGLGNLYVADSGNHAVKEVKINGGYFISQLLPAGLTFNNSTGIINGTPTAASPAVNYTVTGWNVTGSATATVNITVNPLLPVISYSSPQTYKVGTPIAALAPASSNIAAWGYSNSVASIGSGIIEPLDVAADASGNVYVADIGAGDVVKIPSGNGTPVPLGAFSALGLAVDVSGNVYVANAGSPSIIEVAAGTGTISLIGSGLTSPTALAVDASGNVYVADNATTLKEIPAGNGAPVTIKTGFASIQSIAVDAAGNIYVADEGNGAVYKIPAGGGSMVSVGTGFSKPSGVIVDAAGNLYVSDINKTSIIVIEPNGTQFTIGSGFSGPNGLAIDGSGNLYVADPGNHAVKEIKINGGYFLWPLLPAGLTFDNSTGIISGMPTAASPAANYTVNGWNATGSATATVNITVNPLPLPTLSYSSPQTYRVGAPITSLAPASSNVATWGYSNSVATIFASLSLPMDVAVDASGNVYVPDFIENVIKEIPAGNGTPVVVGRLTSPDGVAVDAAGNVYVCGPFSSTLAKIQVGSGAITGLGSGFNHASALAVDGSGNVYVADSGNGALKEILAGDGTTVTIKSGFSNIQGVAVDATRNIYVADMGNGTVYEVLGSSGTMITRGSGFNQPSGVAVDAAGNLYVSDKNHSYLTVIEPNGMQFNIGSGFSQANALALDNSGNLYVIDLKYSVVKKVTINGGYFLSPLLPAGLTFDNNTGIISGTPTTASPAANYTVTGWNFTGSAAATVNIKVLSNDATINLFQISNGTLSPSFLPNTTTYADTVANFTSGITVFLKTTNPGATVMVNGTPVTSGIRSSSFPLNINNNVLNIVVTAEDGVTTKTYTIAVTRSLPDNALLRSIAVSPAARLVGAAGPAYLNYTAAVSNGTANVQVIPTAQDANATITVNGSPVVSGSASNPIALNVGPNVITTVVTAQNGKTSKTAIITINRAGPSNNALLANIKTDPVATLVGAAGPGYLNFTAAVANSTNSIKVIATAKDANATITVNGLPAVSGSPSSPIALSVGPNVITTVITAQDGLTTRTIMITVNRAPTPSNADLLSLTTNPKDANLHGTTGPGYLNYTELVSNSTSTIKVIATAKDPLDAITINGQLTKSGTPSLPITLAPGPNLFSIIITAEDGVTTRLVTLTITRQNPPPALYDVYNPISVTKPADSVSIADDGVMVHQALSPNGDGINDFLVIDGITSYPDNKLVIIDRNGAMVYQAQGYDNSTRLFDGHSNINGRMQLQGTYFYSLDYSANGTLKHKTGYIVLKY